MADKSRYTTRSSTARIVYYHYKKQNFGTASNVRKSFSSSTVNKIIDRTDKDFSDGQGYIESEIDNLSVSKNISSPSASFSVNLFPTVNWKKVLHPGDWVLIYLFEDHEMGSPYDPNLKNLVLMGNIDRISRVREKDEETDKVTLRYRISGRNFGKVFEKTDLWFDPYQKQAKSLDVTLRTAGLPLIGTPDELSNSILDIFLGDGGEVKGVGKTTALNQWSLPSELSSVWGGKNIYDILDNKIEKGLPGFKPRLMLAPNGNGSLWDQLKKASNDLVNEIFLEEVADEKGNRRPTLVLRPRPHNTPFFDSQFGSKDKALKGLIKYKTLQDHAQDNPVDISVKDILFEDLGKDDHSRFNMFWLSTRNLKNEHHSYFGNLNTGDGVGLPMVSQESIKRYGLRRYENSLDFCYTKAAASGKSLAIDLYKAFLVQLYDFNYANHLYDQGTMETIGDIRAELGKVLKVRYEGSGKDKDEKIFYIEGYEHSFSSLGKWTTSYTLTKGQYLTNDMNVFIDCQPGAPLNGDFGRDDQTIDDFYSIKGNYTGAD